MKKVTKLIWGAVPVLALAVGASAQASSHREAPSIADDPAADNTDTYAWMSPDGRFLNVVANWIPLEEPSGGPNFHKFSSEVRYEVHITRGNQNLNDAYFYVIQFNTSAFPQVDPADLNAPLGGGKEFFYQISGQTQNYSVTKYTSYIDSLNRFRYRETYVAGPYTPAPANIGPRTDAVVRANVPYDDAYAQTFVSSLGGTRGRVFAGPRDDAFYVDLGGIFDLANLRPTGVAQDGVAGYNTHSIALEIPLTELLPANRLNPDGTALAGFANETVLGVWAASSRRQQTVRGTNGVDDQRGSWIQVSRLGLPLVNEALIGLQDKDRWNRLPPSTDVPVFGAYFLNPVIVRDAEAVGIYAALGVDPTPFRSNRLDIIDIINLTNYPTPGAHNIPLSATGDVLRVAPDAPAGFPNGRPLQGGALANQEQADVTDVLLSVLLAGGALAISDGVNYNDKNLLTVFPYLPLPHRGYDEGHGTPTP